MKLLKWAYTRRYHIKARFEPFIHSDVIFRPIKDYYFIYTVKWSNLDPVVETADLEAMELLLNKELGTEKFYLNRIAFGDY